MLFRTITVSAAALLCAIPVAAQQRGTVEFGAFGSAGRFDKSLTLDKAIGAGGHVGVYLDPRWAIEFEKGEMRAGRTLGLRDVNVGILAARLVATPYKAGRLSLLLGAGAGAGTETNFLHSYGVNALLGAKINLNQSVAVRIDGIADWLANNDWKSYQRIRFGLTFARNPRNKIETVVRTVEVPAPPQVFVQRPDSVSAEEQARLRRADQEYRNLRDSLSRIPVPAPVSSASALASMESRILFAFDKSELTDAAKLTLDEKVAVFRANPSLTIMITGHAGNMGTEKYNMALGNRRAEAAKAYLVSRGIDASRVQIDSKGEMQPAVSPPAVGIAQNAPNRRGEFRLLVVSEFLAPARQ